MDDGPSTAAFLASVLPPPAESRYTVTPEVVRTLHRSLYSQLLADLPAAYLLPRAAAPSSQHALNYLEQSGWKLVEAQKRGAQESLSQTGKGKMSVDGEGPGESLGPEYGEDRRGMPCGHVFKKGEAVYRCRDCALDDTCVQCAACFQASEHVGHDIVFSVSLSPGGCCDCGDVEAWKRPLRCKYHEPDGGASSQSEAGPSGTTSSSSSAGGEPMDSETEAEELFGDEQPASSKGKTNLQSSLPDTRELDTELGRMPQDLRIALERQVSMVLDCVLDTLEHAPDEMTLPTGPEVVSTITGMPTLDPEKSETQEDPTVDAPGAYSFQPSASGKVYSVILWNDEKHSFKEVIDQVTDATGVSEAHAKGVAERVDKHGREIVESSSEVRRLLLLARKLAHIDLAVTIRPAYDAFAEEICGHLLSYLLDLANCSLYIPPPAAKANDLQPHHHDNFVQNAVLMRMLIARQLLGRWHHRKGVSAGHMSSDFFNVADVRQIDGLLLMDAKMWKEARGTCKSLYMALIAPREVKRQIAFRFAKMYPRMVETFILQDREPEHSICFMTVQLFSVPSVAAELVVRDSFLEKLLQILQAIFTGQLFNGRLKLPPTPPANGQASPQSIGVRQQRCYHIFYDMRYLLSAAGVQQQVMHNPRHLMYFLDFLALFNAITPDRRAVSTHVEWESETWITVFHVSSHLGRAAKLLGGAFAGADTRRLQVGLGTTTKRILLSCLTLHQNNPEVHPPISFHTVRFGLSTYQVIDFAVDRQAVSFHHPMHWVLAEMLKNVKILKEEDLRSIGKSSLGELMGDGVDANGMLVILEFPLRVCVKLAQIRSGMWVRNGLALRSQAHHYRDNSMRDTMYDQDLYLLQCGLVIVDPNRMLVSMMDRFALLDWFSGTTIHDVYDADQATFMVEEFLFLLVTCLSEISIAAAWTMEEQIRREIIHFLALNQGTFTEVTKHISERMTDHSSFDRVLTQVSNYRPPDGTTDLGIFELKDECYDEVQPFFFHYTRNQRERVEEVLRERKKKKTGRDDAIAIPKKLDITEGPFTALRQVYMSEVFLQILYHALFNVARAYSDAPDTLIDAALHLIMLALVEHEDSFAWLTAATYFDSGAPSRDISSSPEAVPSGQTLVHLLCEIEDDAKLKGFKAKVGWILDRLSSMDGTSQMVAQSRRLAPGVQAGGKGSAEDAKRVAARARQAAIMQQFSARQKSLLESLAEDGSDDDDDELMYAEEEQAEPQKSLGSCILCQEDLDSQQAFGSLALIQPSRVMRTTPKQNAGCLQQSLDTPLTLDRNGPSGRRILGNAESEQPGSSARRREGFSPPNHRLGFYASTCGHLMHVACFKTYCRSVEQRHAQQIARNHPEDLSRSEYVCPLCKSLGNVILPVPDANPSAPSAPVTDETPLADWIRKINIDILKCSTTQSTDVQETDHGTGSFLPWFAEEALGAVLGRPDLANNVEPATYQMLDRLMQVLRPLSSETRSLRQAYQGRTIIAPPSRKMYMPEELVGYTIGVLEISLRGMAPSNGAGPIEGGSGSVADGLTEQTQQLLRSLLDCLRNLAMLDHSSKRGLSVIKQGLLKRLLPHWAGDDTVRSPLLLRDPFTILVEAAVVTPESLQQITALMYYATLVQTVFGLAQPSMWPQSHGGAASRGFAGLRSLHLGSQDLETARKIFPDVRWTVGNIIGFVGYARGNITLGFDQLDDASLAKMLCTYTLPFLRRAAILQRIVGAHVKSGSSDAAGPSGSSYWGSFETDSGVEDSEYVRLLKMLRIPPPAEALPIRAERQTAIAGLVEGWIKHAYAPLASLFRPLPIHPSPLSPAYAGQPAHLHPPHAHPTLLLEHPHIYELVPLPQDLATLLQESQRRKCKRCNEVPPEPAICLVCGDVVCYQCFCCQDEDDERGECNRHMDECGGSMGIYFKVKTNVVVYLYQGNGTFTFSPYLDSHGEIDIGLRKGRPQHLHQQRYDEIRKQYLSHGIGTFVARKIESAMDQGGWETF